VNLVSIYPGGQNLKLTLVSKMVENNNGKKLKEKRELLHKIGLRENQF